MHPTGPLADAHPQWRRTGSPFLPCVAHRSGRRRRRRLTHGFPAHDRYTAFIDGHAAVTITAEPVVPSAARYDNYDSDDDNPCLSCCEVHRTLTRAQNNCAA